MVNGSIASSAVTVNSGAILAGTGTVGATTINSGGIFAPGAAGGTPATMTVQGNLAFQSGALYLVQVNPSTASSDRELPWAAAPTSPAPCRRCSRRAGMHRAPTPSSRLLANSAAPHSTM